MDYKTTSNDKQKVVFLGVEVSVRQDGVHTTIFDREEEYPFHIQRYPAADMVTPQQQLGGV